MKKVYFPQYGGRHTEQNLVQDLVDEQIKLFGSDVYYIPRTCLLYTSPSPRDVEESRMPSSA